MYRPFLIAVSLLLTSGWLSAEDHEFRVEYTLEKPRSRDPVLGGTRDKVFVSVWIPDGVKICRGGICNPFSKGDSVGKHWQAACRHWKFAYVQTDFDAVDKKEYALLAKGLTELAQQSQHPELAHLPLCFTGMSRGGGMSMQLTEIIPQRTIAAAPVCLEVGPTTEASRLVPVVTIFGEKDGKQMPLLLEKLPPAREQNARWGIAVQWGRGHEFALANNLSFVFFDDVIARRLPPESSTEPIQLNDYPLALGWTGDQTTWNKTGTPAKIANASSTDPKSSAACWFPSQRSAAVWQAFVSSAKEIKIKEPPGLGDKQPFVLHSAKSPVKVAIEVDASLQASTVELWNAHVRLARKEEAPWTFEVSLLAGIHSLIAVVGSENDRKSSRPHTIVVGE